MGFISVYGCFSSFFVFFPPHPMNEPSLSIPFSFFLSSLFSFPFLFCFSFSLFSFVFPFLFSLFPFLFFLFSFSFSLFPFPFLFCFSFSFLFCFSLLLFSFAFLFFFFFFSFLFSLFSFLRYYAYHTVHNYLENPFVSCPPQEIFQVRISCSLLLFFRGIFFF